MTEGEPRRYEKRINICDRSDEVLRRCISMLSEFMMNHKNEHGTSVEFFRFRFTDSETVRNAKELILEWAEYD